MISLHLSSQGDTTQVLFAIEIDDEKMSIVVRGNQEPALRRVAQLSSHNAYELTVLAAGLRVVSRLGRAQPLFTGQTHPKSGRPVALWPALRFQVGRPRLVGEDVGMTIYCTTKRSRLRPKRVEVEFIDGGRAVRGEVSPAAVLDFSAQLAQLAETLSSRFDKPSKT